MLHLSAAEKGRIEAGIHIPDQPDDCRQSVPHAPRKVGDEAVSILKREGKQLDKANARIVRCANDRDNVAAGLAGK